MRIEHVAMYVNDLEKAKEFFIRYFGAVSNEMYHNQKTNFRSYFLSFTDGTRLEIMNKPDVKESENKLLATGYIHMAFSVGSKEKVNEMTRQFREDGYEVISGPALLGMDIMRAVFWILKEIRLKLPCKQMNKRPKIKKTAVLRNFHLSVQQFFVCSLIKKSKN